MTTTLFAQALTGRRAVVTGAGQGIGRGIALALATAGARVALVGRTPATLATVVSEIEARGGEALALQADVSQSDAADDVVARVVAGLGGLDILVNNAQSPAPGSLLEVTEQAYGDSLDSGPTATWRLMRAAHPHLRDGGVVLNLTSAAGMQWNPSGTGAYAAAKEAIRVLTRTAACEWAQDGIRVNALLPLADSRTMQDWAQFDPEGARQYLQTVPLGRLGDPESDIGPAAVFLCTEAARYITGHTLAVDGGQAQLR